MAGRLRLGGGLLLAALFLAAGCGVKSLPIPSVKVAPSQVGDVAAKSVAEGVEVTFSVPSSDKPDRRIEEVRLYYAYLPVTGDPDCPPCPPRLRQYRTFELTGDNSQLMEGGRFKYLDREVPFEQEAVYRVMLVDASDRKSPLSNQARVPRVRPLPAPAGLEAESDDSVVILTWDGVTAPLGEPDGFAGYVVFRKGPEGESQLNFQPLRDPQLVDRTVKNGEEYTYQVAAVRRIGRNLAVGDKGAPRTVVPHDQKPPEAPGELMAIPAEGAVLLRFAPSPDQDVKGYVILRGDRKEGPFARLNPELVVENTFEDRTANPKKGYFYRVKAVDLADNESPLSEVYEYKPAY